MATGVFFVTFKTNNPTLYFIGLLIFLLLGIGVTVFGFTSGNTALGIFGIVMAVVAIIMIIEYFATK